MFILPRPNQLKTQLSETWQENSDEPAKDPELGPLCKGTKQREAETTKLASTLTDHAESSDGHAVGSSRRLVTVTVEHEEEFEPLEHCLRWMYTIKPPPL